MVEQRIINDLVSRNSFSLSIVICEIMTVEQGELNFHSPTLRGNILRNIQKSQYLLQLRAYIGRRV